MKLIKRLLIITCNCWVSWKTKTVITTLERVGGKNEEAALPPRVLTGTGRLKTPDGDVDKNLKV